MVKVFHGDVDILFLSKDTCVYSPPLKYLIAHVKSDKGIGRSLCKTPAFVFLVSPDLMSKLGLPIARISLDTLLNP